MMITENVNWKAIKVRSESGKMIFTYADIAQLTDWQLTEFVRVIAEKPTS